MSSSTTNLGLTKLTTGENFSNTILNENWDKVDNGYGRLNSQKVTKYRHSITNQSVITTSHISDAISACATSGIRGSVAIEFYRTDQSICVGTLWYNITSATYGAGILTSYYNDYLQSVFCVNGTFTMKRIALVD